MHVQEALRRALDAAISDGRVLYIVLDAAQAEGSHHLLDRWGVPYESLFKGTREESLIEIAPLLIDAANVSEEVRARLFEWAQRLAYECPCVSWLECVDAMPQLAEHLRQFHVVGLSEGQSMLLRWYDTRILPVWFGCLTGAQADAFASGISRWEYVDRVGGVCELALEAGLSGVPTESAFGEPLIVLNDTQYGMLVDASDLDVMLGHLRRIIPDEIKQVPQRTLALFVSKHQQGARSAGLDDIDRQTQYVLLALYTSGKGVDVPEFKAFLKSPPPNIKEFSKAMQGLSDAVWEAGPPLWKSGPQATIEPLVQLTRPNA
jgi:Domain of unknown function (DUF4123)